GSRRACPPTGRRSRHPYERAEPVTPDVNGTRRARNPRLRRTRCPDRRTRARTDTGTRPCYVPPRSAPPLRRVEGSDRTPRSAPRAARARRVARARRRGSPPDGAFHRRLDVPRVPEVGGEVLPAPVGEDRDDHAFFALGRQLPRDVHDCTRGHAG